MLVQAYLKRLKSTDGSLWEDVSVESAECQADIGLCEAEFDSPLFKLTSERFQVVRRRRLTDFLVINAAITTSGCRAARYTVGTRRRVDYLIDTLKIDWKLLKRPKQHSYY